MVGHCRGLGAAVSGRGHGHQHRMIDEMTEHKELVAQLTARWPEHRVAPSLGRIAALCGLLGDPQDSVKVIHLTGTNGKGSTAAMIDALLRSVGLRTGRFTSPHLSDVTERIAIDGQAISAERFGEVWDDVAPYVAMVDEQKIDGVDLTFFEVITAMAYAAFADAPVDVAIVEVGLGGTWDATNVADGDVAVVLPIDLDHTHLLGSTVAEIAAEKAGIIKPGAHAILAGQSVEAAQVLLARCAEVGALPQREGVDFGLLDRQLAVGGQVLRLNAAEGPIGDIHLPLHGAHMARNAAVALAAAEAFMGLKGLNPQIVTEGFAEVQAPGRLETVRDTPPIVIDGAHNPHATRATAEAIGEAFNFDPLIGVVSMMSDKDVEEVLKIWEGVMDQIVCTQNASTSRGMTAEDLAEVATGIFGGNRVRVQPSLDSAIETAVQIAESAGMAGEMVGETLTQLGVLVTGSVIGIGEARTLLVGNTVRQREEVVDDGEQSGPGSQQQRPHQLMSVDDTEVSDGGFDDPQHADSQYDDSQYDGARYEGAGAGDEYDDRIHEVSSVDDLDLDPELDDDEDEDDEAVDDGLGAPLSESDLGRFGLGIPRSDSGDAGGGPGNPGGRR